MLLFSFIWLFDACKIGFMHIVGIMKDVQRYSFYNIPSINFFTHRDEGHLPKMHKFWLTSADLNVQKNKNKMKISMRLFAWNTVTLQSPSSSSTSSIPRRLAIRNNHNSLPLNIYILYIYTSTENIYCKTKCLRK